MSSDTLTLDQVISVAKRRGFVFPTSSIYGGLASSYDYGPLGAELLRTIRNLWWEAFVSKRSDMIGLDSAIILHPQTWVASGHVSSFSDPLVEDVASHKRYRADHLIEDWLESHSSNEIQKTIVEDMSVEDMANFIAKHQIQSPEGNPITAPKSFNLLFKTEIGAVTDEKSVVYLRGETAQGIFSNFKNILDTTRVELPFGVGQIGKSFRNEITTGQFIFRTLEFEQAEIEYFFNPNRQDWQKLMEDWKSQMWSFVVDTLGINPDKLRWRKHSDTERSFYSQDTYDLEYQYPFGWKELWGIAYRTNYDLQQHAQASGESLTYLDPYTNERFTPHVIEPALGINRALLMVLTDRYQEDLVKNRLIFSCRPQIAPFKAAIFPLVKNKPDLRKKAQELYANLLRSFVVTYDERGNIGKRYLAQDEIGTPVCVTVDYQTLEDDTVTIRDRDTAQQVRIAQTELAAFLTNMVR